MSNTLFRKATASIAALSIVLSVVSPVVGVKADDTSVDAANRLASLGVIVDNSTDPSKYNLDSSITRREMLKIMMNLSSIEVTDTCEGKFSDLSSTDWGCKYAEAALKAGFIAANPTFRPDDMVTEAEALKMVMQARGISKTEGVDDWAEAYKQAAVEVGILSSDATISSTGAAKRSMVIVSADSAVSNTTNDYDDFYDDDLSTDDSDDIDLDDLFGDLFDDDSDDLDTTDTDNTDDTDDTDNTDNTDDTDDTDDTSVIEGDLEVSLNPTTPDAQNIPNSAANVEFMVFDLTAGSSDVSVDTITLQRVDLGSRDDFNKVWISQDGVVITNDKTISSDDTVTLTLDTTIKAGSTETFTVNASMAGNTSKVNAFEIVDIETDADVDMLDVRGNSMTTVSYSVAEITLTPKGTNTDIDTATEDEIIGEFKLEETETNSKKAAIIKSIRFKATGGMELEENLDNIALYSDGDQVSEETIVDGDYVTFKLDDLLIEDAKSKYFEIKADIISGDDSDTLAFSVKDDFDIYAIEEGTSVGAAIVKGASLKTYTLNAGKIRISQDTSTPSSDELIADTDEVLTFVAKVDTDQEVTVDSFRLYLDASSSIVSADGDIIPNEIEDLDASIENIKVYVNDTVVDSVDKITDADGGGRAAAISNANDYFSFDSSFTLEDDDLIKVYVDFTKDAQATTKLVFKIDNAGTSDGNSDSLKDVEYTSDGETVKQAKLTGTATSNALTVIAPSAGSSVVENSGISNGEVVLAGQKGTTLMKFVVNAGNSSDLQIKKLNFDFAADTVADDNDGDGVAENVFASVDITNVRLLKDDSQVGSTEDVTSGTLTIDSLDEIISKGGQETYELVADIDTSATTTDLNVTLDGSDSVYYDVNDNELSTGIAITDITSAAFNVSSNAKLTIAVDGDTPDSAIVLADTTSVEVAKYKFSATDGQVNIKDLYFVNPAATDDRISAVKLVVDGTTLDSRVPSGGQIHFDLGTTNQIEVEKDDDVVVSLKVDLNKITGATHTNKEITLELTDLVAETEATSNELTKVENAEGVAGFDADDTVVSLNTGDHYTTSEIVGELDIIADTMYIRKTQPTLATQSLDTSKLSAGEQTLYKFTINADSKEDVEVAQIKFTVTSSFTNAVTLDTYKLYVNGDEVQAAELDTLAGGAVPQFRFADGEEIVVAGGGSAKTFELKGTIGGAALSDGDYVTIKVTEDASDAAAAADTKASAVAAAASNFIWSDNAGSPHSETTADWFNGYKVNGLDTSSVTLEKD